MMTAQLTIVRTALLAVALGVGLPAAPDGTAPAAPQSAEYVVDRDASTIVAVLHKGGLLRFLGHEHGVLAGDWSARIAFDPEDPESTEVSVEVRVGSLIIDSAEARGLAGIDPDGPDEEEVAEISKKMLAADQLDAGRFETITFESRRVEVRSDDDLRWRGSLTIHGVTREVEVTAELFREEGALRVRGELEIKLRDFDIEPVSIGGVVKVSNDVDIKFDIRARRR